MKSFNDEICKHILKMDNDRMDRMTKAILEAKEIDKPMIIRLNRALFMKSNRAIRNECKERTNDS